MHLKHSNSNLKKPDRISRMRIPIILFTQMHLIHIFWSLLVTPWITSKYSSSPTTTILDFQTPQTDISILQQLHKISLLTSGQHKLQLPLRLPLPPHPLPSEQWWCHEKPLTVSTFIRYPWRELISFLNTNICTSIRRAYLSSK